MKKRSKKSKKPVLAQKYQGVLRDQVIAEDSPGTILRDFEILLDFVAAESPKVSKKNKLPAIGMLSIGFPTHPDSITWHCWNCLDSSL